MISVESASKKLNITPQQVRSLCRTGKLKSEKVGNTWIIDNYTLENFIDSSHLGVAEDQATYIKNSSSNNPIVLSFFSGAMGLDLGIEKAGFKTIFACEVNNACRKTIIKNKPEIGLNR